MDTEKIDAAVQEVASKVGKACEAAHRSPGDEGKARAARAAVTAAVNLIRGLYDGSNARYAAMLERGGANLLYEIDAYSMAPVSPNAGYSVQHVMPPAVRTAGPSGERAAAIVSDELRRALEWQAGGNRAASQAARRWMAAHGLTEPEPERPALRLPELKDEGVLKHRVMAALMYILWDADGGDWANERAREDARKMAEWMAAHAGK